MTTEGHSDSAAGRFDTFETWKQYQAVAMHFNDLLMRLRSASLAAVGAFAAIAGVVVKTDVAPDLRWGTLAGVFLLLASFWLAMWVLDFQYYNRLLIGAVDALIELEEHSKTSAKIDQLVLSTRIEAVVAEGKRPGRGKLGREGARWWFYSIVFVTLLGGFGFSVYSAGGVQRLFTRPSAATELPANIPLQPTGRLPH